MSTTLFYFFVKVQVHVFVRLKTKHSTYTCCSYLDTSLQCYAVTKSAESSCVVVQTLTRCLLTVCAVHCHR